MMSVFDRASMGVLIMRVSDLATSIEWYREKLGLEPLHVGADGAEHPTATYGLGPLIATLWQLPCGVKRDPNENDRNSYPVFVVDAPEAVRSELAARGVHVGELRHSENNRYFWFNDLDGNRFEIACPVSETARADADHVRAASS